MCFEKTANVGGTVTPDRQQLIQDSWRAIEPNAVRLVELAVLHLVQIAPTSRPLLAKHRLPAVCESVARVVGELVDALDEPKRFVPLAVGLGRGNPDRGLSAPLYPAMGEALSWALHLHLGDSFTRELQTAWTEGYQLASAIMKRGEQSQTGEFERFRTGEFAAFQSSMSK